MQPDRETSLARVLEVRAKEQPNALAFDVVGERLVYGDLARGAAEVGALLGDNGVAVRDRCALVLPTGAPLLYALFGCHWIGATPVIIDPGLPPVTRNRRIELVEPALTVSLGELRDAPPGPRCDLTDWRPGELTPAARARVSSDDLAYLQLTSGTEGEPRAAMITHGALSASLWHACRYMQISPTDVMVSWLPLHHDFGLVRFALSPVFSGIPCYLLPPSILSLEAWLRTVSERRGTITGSPDFGYRIATQMVSPDGLDLTSLRYASNGGEPVRAETIRRFEARFGVADILLPGYGQAEAVLTVSTCLPGTRWHEDRDGFVSNGRPVACLDVRLVDDGRVCRPGEVGEIMIRGETLFSGYFDAADPDARRPRDEWFGTGDLGYLDEAGHLVPIDRLRNVIKTGGKMIAPVEVAKAVDGRAEVRFSAAVGVPNPKLGDTEDLVVVVEVRPHDGATPSHWDRLARSLSDEVKAAIGTRPWQVLLCAPRTIPKTHNGKLRHRQLRQSVIDGAIRRQGQIIHALTNA